MDLIRDVIILALFELKAHMGLLCRPEVKAQTATLLRQCRNNRDAQRPYPCRFFYVVGVLPPFQAVELDIDTGECTGRVVWLPERPQVVAARRHA